MERRGGLQFPAKASVTSLEVFVSQSQSQSCYLISQRVGSLLSPGRLWWWWPEQRLLGDRGHLCSVITNHHLCHNNQVMRVINSPAHVNIYNQGYSTNTHHHHLPCSNNAISKQKYYWDVIEIFMKYLFWFGYCLLHHGYCAGSGLTVNSIQEIGECCVRIVTWLILTECQWTGRMSLVPSNH